MDINEFKQVLKNNVSELIALQEQCQNTDVKCAQSILDTILWMKEINALKEELHDIHGSLKHTVQRERTAFNAWLQQRTAQTISWTASAELLSKQNRILSSVLQSAPKNWRKCINVPPPISKPRRNYWKNIVKS